MKVKELSFQRCKRNWIKSPIQNDACMVVSLFRGRNTVFTYFGIQTGAGVKGRSEPWLKLGSFCCGALQERYPYEQRKERNRIGSYRLLEIDCSFMSTIYLFLSWKTLRLTATHKLVLTEAAVCNSSIFIMGILERHVKMLQFLMGKEI